MNDLEELIRLSHIVARPYYIAVWVLSLLLVLSVAGNVYLATVENEVIIEHNGNFDKSDYNDNHLTKG